MARDIIFSANNNEEIIVLPVVPELEIDIPQNNEEFETMNNGVLNLIGDIGLRTFSITSILPNQNYSWLRPNSIAEPFIYVDFFNKWRMAKIPIRVITSRMDGTEWFNMSVLINNFNYTERRNGQIDYTLDVKEYRFVGGV